MSTLARACGLAACWMLCACFDGPRGVVIDGANDLATGDLAAVDLGAGSDFAPSDLAVVDLAVPDLVERDLLTPDLTTLDYAHTPELLIEDFCPMSLTGYVRCYVHSRPPDGY